jgi:hypothetical protein
MRILFSLRTPTATRNFESTLRALAERGHEVHLAFERRKENVNDQLALIDALCEEYPGITQGWSPVPSEGDPFYPIASKLRYAGDYLRYLEPRYRDASKLRERAERRAPPDIPQVARWPLVRTPAGLAALRSGIRRLERVIPQSGEFEAFLREQAPDVVLVTPMLHVGPQGQVELLRAARALGIPSGLCVHSWDNLTNKGLLHEIPDMVAVWNHLQEREAIELHGVAPQRVAVTGAPAFDHWFDWRPSTSREEFCARIGLRPDRPFVLYVGSSVFVAPHEVRFALRWLEGIRASGHPDLAEAGVLFRPYPVASDPWLEVDLDGLDNVAIYPRTGADPVDRASREDFYDSIYHSAAVVGVNTSALIESAAVGRDTYTLLAPEYRDTQEGTLHFHYLLRENGGPLHVAASMQEHAQALAGALASGPERDEQRTRFVDSFLRPHGRHVAATDHLVAAIERLAARAPSRERPRSPRLRRARERVTSGVLALISTRYRLASPRVVHRRFSPRPGKTGVRILFCMAYPGYLRYYDTVVEGLAERGHEVFLAFEAPQKQAEGLNALEGASERIVSLGRLELRRDTWQPVLRSLRRVTDYVRYLEPRFADAHYLRGRARGHLPRGTRFLSRWQTLPERRVRRLLQGLLAVERAIPSARFMNDFLDALDPDVVVLTPLLTDASRQTDVVKSARALGIPTVMGVASWDHLTTKGMIRIMPDRVLLWNELLRDEAITLHGVPEERILVTGAQPFDRWFERRPARDAAAFRRRVGLRTDAPFVLFVGSTASISHPEYELLFVRRWIEAIRASGHQSLRDIAVLVRPHPYNPGLWADADLSGLGDVAVWPRGGANPVDPENRNDYFDSMYHSAAVVGINTSAFVEASIVGCSVLTVRPPEFADTQDGTLHFHYLRPENGGPLMVSDDLDHHIEQLASVLEDPALVRQRVERFVASFVRPRGLEQPCTPIVVEAIEREAARGRQPSQVPPRSAWPLAATAWVLGMWLTAMSEEDRQLLGRVLLKRHPAVRHLSRLGGRGRAVPAVPSAPEPSSEAAAPEGDVVLGQAAEARVR